MATTLKGRKVRIEVGKTEGAAKTVSEVTAANPGVASSTAHGLANGSVGYFDAVVGMSEIDGQAVRLSSVATDAFTLETIDTSGFGDFTSGSFVPVTAWSTLSRAASYAIPEGAADKLDDTTLLDDIKQESNGLLAAQSVQIDLKHLTEDEEALALVNAAAISGAYQVYRITFPDGAQRIFRGQPSLTGESVGQGAIGTGSFTIAVKGRVLRLPA